MSERTALYRMFDAAGDLLYVGISKNFGTRWQREAREMPWWGDVQRQTIDWCDSREDALSQERTAIRTEHPKYNIIHARPLPQPKRSIIRRLVSLAASEPGEAGGIYDLDHADIVAPGTYRITFGYDPAAAAFEAVSVTECVLLEGGDAVSEALGGKSRPMVTPLPGVPAHQIGLDEALDVAAAS